MRATAKRCFWIVLILTSLLLAGCKDKSGSETEQQATVTPQPEANDYNGALGRIGRISGDAQTIISSYMENAKAVMEQNPTDYWTVSDFFHINLEFPDLTAREHTEYLNERATWEETYNLVYKTFLNSEGKLSPKSLSITRNSEGDYTVYFKDYVDTPRGRVFTDRTVNCIYDASHDWLRTYVLDYSKTDKVNFLDYLIEYARLENDTFLVQTQKERFACTYNPDGTVKSFWYSQLNAKKDRAKYHPYIVTEPDIPVSLSGEPTKAIEYVDVDTTGKNLNIYDSDDTIFTRLSSFDSDSGFSIDTEKVKAWVFEEPTTLVSASYEDGILTVQKINELSGELEVYKVSGNGRVDRENITLDTDEVFGTDVTVYEEEVTENGSDTDIPEQSQTNN